ncbi:hypothetical protein A2954_05685 [Candidatus Roizmanbacteria bacterium RIFCSPLOWO2_01_FULL_37_12]|uniref:Addiction module toxin, HicA family n=1 Tax=Candidatus Roizmanbacteria bacterium RIFCSPLOWO2_01_FULL_37_12 TaxID=1802056 RepID=A0A1F7IBS9_9BACT|nr:MAG: hypothetical protein A2768_02425 [Candidatus Roizmanbacteria bacterium RIFCSPHIGHO2_01_FULL_37_16]OGK25965.1 MAG: hypothetical protein A3D76_03300 [Candidatus Roizmanbacteria bacterium RIFCSPHIGHO2_02_FULL_37_9b]OGK40800.1 MAG: hypothetical protein A2954_05685 [Candidatus Roizmanbacteria bacterium RIFCSPLOWO2_01_FULL_37_12]
MPRIPPIKADKLIKIFLRNGFILKRIKGSHHILVNNEGEKRVIIPYHQGKTLGKGLTVSIIKDAGLTPEEFLKLLRKK